MADFVWGPVPRYFFKMKDQPPTWKELERTRFLEMLADAPARSEEVAGDHPEEEDMSYVFAEHRPFLSERERTLFMACGVKHHGTIVAYLLVDENGSTTYRCETSRSAKVFHMMATQAAMDNWKVEKWKA